MTTETIANPSTKSKDALYFLTEQARCLAQASGRETDDFRVCLESAEYLANGDADTLAHFREQTEAVRRDPTGLADYDVEDYDGKATDLCAALNELALLGLDETVPEAARQALLKAAEIISGFYEAGSVLDAAFARAVTA